MLSECAAHPANLVIGSAGQPMLAAMSKQLRERKLQQRQGSALSMQIEEQVAHQVVVKGQPHVWQQRGPLDHLAQFLLVHRQDSALVLLNETTEGRIGKGPIIEVSTQAEEHEHRTVWLGGGSDQDIKKMLTFWLSNIGGEDLLKLVNRHHDAHLGLAHQRQTQLMQAEASWFAQEFADALWMVRRETGC